MQQGTSQVMSLPHRAACIPGQELAYQTHTLREIRVVQCVINEAGLREQLRDEHLGRLVKEGVGKSKLAKMPWSGSLAPCPLTLTAHFVNEH